MKRYIKSDTETFMASKLKVSKLKKCLQYYDDVIAKYTTTDDYYWSYYCIIDKDSDDIANALEDTLHRLIDNGMEAYIHAIMNAYIPDEEEMEELEEYDEYTEIDLGYVIPGLIETFEKLG